MPWLTSTGTESLGPADVPEKVIPQRGLTKLYQNERVRFLPGSNFSFHELEPTESRDGIPLIDNDVPVSNQEIIVEMQGVRVKYGDKEILGGWEQEIGGRKEKGLSWTVRRGERWGIFGPNGMCSTVHEGSNFELTGTRVWKNNTRLSNLLRPPSSLLFTY